MAKIQNFKIPSSKFQVPSSNHGFSLLFALLITSIVAAISVSVSEIFLIELMITGSVKESQFAFYAADAGAECILYWDFMGLPNQGFPDGFSTTTAEDIICNNENKTLAASSVKNFQLLFKDTAGNPTTCANIVITINDDKSRKIESFGRSRYIGSDCGTAVSRRAERGLEVKY